MYYALYLEKQRKTTSLAMRSNYLNKNSSRGSRDVIIRSRVLRVGVCIIPLFVTPSWRMRVGELPWYVSKPWESSSGFLAQLFSGSFLFWTRNLIKKSSAPPPHRSMLAGAITKCLSRLPRWNSEYWVDDTSPLQRGAMIWPCFLSSPIECWGRNFLV